MYEDYAKIRDAKGLKDSDVCRGTGISHGTLSDWKKGRYELKSDKLKKIADFLNVPVDAFFGVPKKGHKNGYYVYGDTAELAQAYFEDPMTRVLFDARRGASAEDVQMAVDLLIRLKRTNPDG